MSNSVQSCRVCLVDNYVGGRSFDEDENLLQLFEFCSGLYIANTTPRVLCEICVEDLQRFAKFKKKCAESELFWESFRNCDSVTNEKSIKNEKDLDTICNDNRIDSFHYEPLSDNGNITDYESVVNNKESKELITNHNTRKNRLKKKIAKKRSTMKTSAEDKDVGARNSCGLCNALCAKPDDLNEHLSIHMAQGNLKCQLCEFMGRDFADMVTHRYNHETCKVFSCFLCELRKGSLLSLQFHFRHVHLNKIGGWCAVCGKTFKVYKSWRRHMLVHKRSKELLVCDYCGKRYLYKYQMEEHIVYHLRKSQFVCETCGKGFHKKYNLQSHQRHIHASSAPVKCGHCDKTYKNQDTLNVHMKSVTREKPYMCELCSKGFVLPSLLKSHLFFHTGQKPFECDVCGLKYKTKGSLNCHKLKHLGIFKHKCSKCARSFATPVQLRRHLSVHTGVRKFQCAHCDKSFNERFRFEAHAVKHRDGLQVKTEA